MELLLSEWVLGQLAPESVPALAVTALQDGCESAAVAVLAGLQRPTRAEIEAELPGLLRDLGAARPTRLDAFKRLADDRAAGIASGSVEPLPGAEYITALWHSGFASDQPDSAVDRHPELWLDVRPFVTTMGPEIPAAPAGARAAGIVEHAHAVMGRGGFNISSRLAEGQLDGRELVECAVQEHVLGDAHTAVRLGLAFVDGLFITLGVAADGVSLRLGHRPLQGYDLGEHGRIAVRSDGFPCDVLVPGATVRTVAPLVDDAGVTVGARIDSDAASLHVLVRDGNLVMSASQATSER